MKIFPNVDIFYYIIFKKAQSIISPSISSEKIFKNWRAVKLTVLDIGFPKFNFHLKIQFYHRKDMLSVVFS